MRDGDGVRIATLVALVCSLLIELASCAMRGAGPGPICEECTSALCGDKFPLMDGDGRTPWSCDKAGGSPAAVSIRLAYKTP